MNKFNWVKNLHLASLLSVFSFAATNSVQAQSIDFSQSPWSSTGNVTVPSLGQATLTNEPGTATVFGSPTFEGFLGIPVTVLDNAGGAEATEGSAIKANQNFNAGDAFSFNWSFTNLDTTGTNASDYAFFMADGSTPGTSDLSFIKLADVVGNNASNPFTYIFPRTDNYTIAIGITDIVDYTGDSRIQISNANLQPVPEPLSIIGSGSALIYGVILKRRFSKKTKTFPMKTK